MKEVNKITFYATDGDGYINRDGSSFFMLSLFKISSNVDLSLKDVAVIVILFSILKNEALCV